MIENSKLLRILFYIGVVLIPFDAVPGPGLIGELAHEGSFYFFFPALAYAILLVIGGKLQGYSSQNSGGRWIGYCGVAFMGCIMLSGIVNLSDIVDARFHSRSGLPKFLTSAIVVAYGFGLAWLTANVVNGHWYERFVVPASISASICVVVAIFEAASARGYPVPFFSPLYSFIHSGTEGPAVLWDGSLNLKVIEGWDKRLRSVSFEPPAFGNFAGLIWPWIACGCLMAPQRRKKYHVVLAFLFTVLIIFAQARTGWLLLACGASAFLALWLVFFTGRGRPGLAWAVPPVSFLVICGGGIWYSANYDALVQAAVNGQSISDITRFAYQVTAYKIFAVNPIFGTGLGQFAFTADQFIPPWGYLSSEIRASMTFPEAPWPNTYSVYARIGAEIGIIGLIAWVGIWLATLTSVFSAGLAKERQGVRVPWEYYAILMANTALFASWVTSDTFRTALIWVTLGAAADVIGRKRHGLTQHASKPL